MLINTNYIIPSERTLMRSHYSLSSCHNIPFFSRSRMQRIARIHHTRSAFSQQWAGNSPAYCFLSHTVTQMKLIFCCFSDEFFANNRSDDSRRGDYVARHSYTIHGNTTKTLDIQYLAFTRSSIYSSHPNRSFIWFDFFSSENVLNKFSFEFRISFYFQFCRSTSRCWQRWKWFIRHAFSAPTIFSNVRTRTESTK